VHGEQSLRIHQLPPPDGEVIGQTQITGIVDKGPGRGALLYTTRTIVDAASGAALATLAATSFARGDGGFGGPQGPAKPVHAIPARLPDFAIESPTLPQAALIYRLSGDYNPLHADPEVAKAAGYERPILHGLCTFGIAGAVILRVVCASDPKRLRSIDARFSAAVFPGETLRTEVWLDGEIASFRSFVAGREALVLNNGRAEIARVS
jgi:acyl dehydratase